MLISHHLRTTELLCTFCATAKIIILLRNNAFGLAWQVMSGGAAAQTLRDSAMRLNHRLRRFAGANALKKIALNVIAKVKGVAE